MKVGNSVLIYNFSQLSPKLRLIAHLMLTYVYGLR